MDTLSITDIILLVLIPWLAVVTFLLFKAKSHWKKISDGKNLNIVQILENILEKQEMTNKSVVKTAQEVNQLRTLTKSSFQKSVLVRFNPFEDTGGDQSFIIALLNGNNTGIVLSSLHSRNGTRIYAKQVVNGESSSHELSKEEKEVLQKAIKG